MSTETFFKAAEEAAAFGRGNFEAVTRSAQTYMQGMQDLSRRQAALAQAVAERTMESFRAFSGVRSVKEAMDVQAGLSQSAFEKLYAEGMEVQQAAVKLAETSFAPINERIALGMKMFNKPFAA